MGSGREGSLKKPYAQAFSDTRFESSTAGLKLEMYKKVCIERKAHKINDLGLDIIGRRKI